MGGRGKFAQRRFGRQYPTVHNPAQETGLTNGGIVAPLVDPPASQTLAVSEQAVQSSAIASVAHAGRAAIPTPPAVAPSQHLITFIDRDAPLGGAIYPFLEATGRAWRIVESDVTDAATRTAYPLDKTFGMETPTLRYVNGSKVEDIFVDGMSTEEFLGKTGLSLSMNKGGFVLSKRLSRLMRPYFASGFFPEEAVTVKYMEHLADDQTKVWDGAGLISRRMLERLTIPAGAPPAKRAALLEELQHCQRVEFTLLSSGGQDKGHAIVEDELEADFVLPVDTKKEVRLTNGQKFVGVNLVHGHGHMRIDIQSLINLHPFFEEQQYARWLDDEGQLFAHAVESGEVAEAMRRIDPYATMKDVEAWHLREFFASGGHPMWFASIARNLMNQHLERLNETTLEKLRLPIPGGRLYVMPMGVGQAAGVDHAVPRGQIRLDPDSATAWVNDEDWVSMQDSPSGVGIRNILGGADNDDALWLCPFTDHDGVQKVLAWRSPNQAGEYVVLQPTVGSKLPEWHTVEGVMQCPPADSRKLFPRTDTQTRAYLGVVDPDSATGLGKGQPYSVSVMQDTIGRAVANAGALGLYCNLLMVSKAVYGDLPQQPPAPLEDFIDASVKTGADLSAGAAWCFEASQRLVERGTAVPALLHKRLALGRYAPPVQQTADHWLDRLLGTVQRHIETVRTQRDVLVKRTMPPARLFDHAFNEADRTLLDVGTTLNRSYRTVLNKALRQHGQLTPEDFETARIAVEDVLARYPNDQQGAILRGALVSTYLSDKPSDAALWLRGPKAEHGYAPGLAQKTLRALREIGLLDEVSEVAGRVARYPGAVVSEPQLGPSIGITGVWFNLLNRQRQENGLPPYVRMGDVPRAEARAAKAEVEQWSQALPMLQVYREQERLRVSTSDGAFLGYVSKDSQVSAIEGEVQPAFTVAMDGNLRLVYRR